MAKSTCNPNIAIPKGMMRFEVIRSTIRDSLGQYCVPGDMAVLDKTTAQGYLDKNYIRVALPDFDDNEQEPEKQADAPSDDESSEDEGERSETEADPLQRRRQRRSRATANG